MSAATQKIYTGSISLIKVSDGESASNYIIQSNSDEVFRFEKEDGTIKFSPGILEFQVIDLSATNTNTCIENFAWNLSYANDSSFTNLGSSESLGDTLNSNIIYGKDPDENEKWTTLAFDITKLYEKVSDDTSSVLYTLLRDRYVNFKLEYIQNNATKATKYFQVKYGVSAEMATFHITASGFVSAIQDTSLEFSKEGLSVTNGDFKILRDAYERQMVTKENYDELKDELYILNDNSTYQKVDENAQFNDVAYYKRIIEPALYFDTASQELTLAGAINARSGSFTGRITADEGYIGGLVIDYNRLRTETANSEGKYDLEIYGNGNIYAKNIALGEGATVTDKITLSSDNVTQAILYNPAKHDGKVLETANLNIYNTGTIKLGTLDLYGGTGNADGYIRSFRLDDNNQSVNGEWIIREDGSATFDNITVDNAYIRNAITEISTIQSVGSTMIFNDAWTIIGPNTDYWKDSNEHYYHVYYVDGIPSFSADDYALVDNKIYKIRAGNVSKTDEKGNTLYGFVLYGDYLSQDHQLKIGQVVTKLGSGGTREYVKSTDKSRVPGRFYYKKTITSDGTISYESYTGTEVNNTECYYLKTSATDDCVISITGASSSDRTDFSSPTSLSFSSFYNTGTEAAPNLIYTKHLILGKLKNSGIDDLRDIDGYGLYADHVYLNGSLITRNLINNDASAPCYAGINTLSDANFDKSPSDATDKDTSAIIFWGGASGKDEAAIQNAKFQVTQNGTLYTQSAIIKNSTFVGGELHAAKVYTAEIYGDSSSNAAGLTIYDVKTGIEFKKQVGNSESFTIGEEGLKKGGRSFVKLTDDFVNFNSYGGNSRANFNQSGLEFYTTSNDTENFIGKINATANEGIVIAIGNQTNELCVQNQKIILNSSSYFKDDLYCGRDNENHYVMEWKAVRNNNQIIGYDVVIH